MDAIFDDLTGQKINKATAYKVKIVQPNKLTLEIDCEFSEQIKNLTALAVENGQKWFVWKKDDNGRLFRDFQSNPEEVV